MSYGIQAEGLTKWYGETTALLGVDIAVRRGTVLGLLGPGGAGKSTVVRILAALLRPDAGHAVVGGYDVLRQPDRVRGIIGVAGHAAADTKQCDFEYLVRAGRSRGLRRAEARRRARELLDRFQLAGAAEGDPYRLALAASLMGRPEILFLEEPVAGLDPDTREIVRSLADVDGLTVLLATRHLAEADRVAGELVVLDHGRVVASGTPARLRAAMGGQTLDVRPVDPADLPAVTAVVGRVTGGTPRLDGDSSRVSAVTEDPATALPEVLSWLQEAGIAVAEIGLRLASLDEVFWTLTGRRTSGTGRGATGAGRRATGTPMARVADATIS